MPNRNPLKPYMLHAARSWRARLVGECAEAVAWALAYGIVLVALAAAAIRKG